MQEKTWTEDHLATRQVWHLPHPNNGVRSTEQMRKTVGKKCLWKPVQPLPPLLLVRDCMGIPDGFENLQKTGPASCNNRMQHSKPKKKRESTVSWDIYPLHIILSVHFLFHKTSNRVHWFGPFPGVKGEEQSKVNYELLLRQLKGSILLRQQSGSHDPATLHMKTQAFKMYLYMWSSTWAVLRQL